MVFIDFGVPGMCSLTTVSIWKGFRGPEFFVNKPVEPGSDLAAAEFH